MRPVFSGQRDAVERYVGRFAPSPSGPLHFGSLVAAVGSYLQARKAGGRWLLRMEDLDTPRMIPGADDDMVRTLDAFGFEWDGPVEFQSRRIQNYASALERLRGQGVLYPCSCSRSQLAAADEQRYPGTCRNGISKPGEPTAHRFRVGLDRVEFIDELQGPIVQNVAEECGDFVVKRRDGIFAYHLAVVVDDADQGITEVVRGADLLSSTPRQLLIQAALNVATPRYCHLPLAIDSLGRKLSKSSQSLPIDTRRSVELLWQSLTFLLQSPPAELRSSTLVEIWSWAQAHWQLDPLRQVKSRQAPSPSSPPSPQLQ